MANHPVHARFDGPIVMIGFGSIGRGTLPLLERHFDVRPVQVRGDRPGRHRPPLLDERKLRFIKVGLTKENYREVLTPLLTAGRRPGIIVNVSVDTSSVDLMELCKEIGALYIDTVAEPWPGSISTTEARRCRSARTTPCARRRARRAPRNARAASPRCPAAAPIPAWCPGSSSRRCSISPATPELKCTSRRPARTGRR